MSALVRLSAALAQCPAEHVLALLGGRWKLAILCRLAEGPRRFGELQRLVHGVTHKMLTQQLRQLERDGMVTRTKLDGTPPGTEYALSEVGESLRAAVSLLEEWGRAHLPTVASEQAAGS